MLKEIKDLAAVLIGWIVGDLTFFLQFLDVLVIPSLEMVRMAEVLTLSVTHSFVSGMKNFLV